MTPTGFTPKDPVHDLVWVVVDPFSSAIALCSQAVEAGYTLVALFSRPLDMWRNYRVNLDLLKCTHRLSIPDVHEAAQTLEAQFPGKAFRVINGSDASSMFTDRLAHLLGAPGRDMRFVHARRYKDRCMKRLAEVGLAHIPTWIVQAGSRLEPEYFPVVAKPAAGGGSDLVFQCKNQTELDRALTQIFQTQTVYAETNTRALVQPYMLGTEYVLNTHSHRGQHRVTAWWLYRKRRLKETEHAPFYEYILSLDPKKEGAEHRWEEQVHYVRQVLDALGFTNGSAHIELFLTEKGPVLCELNPRFPGYYLFWGDAQRAIQGYNDIDLTLEKVMDAPYQPPSSDMKYGCMYIYHPDPETITWDGQLPDLSDKKTLVHTQMLIQPGATVKTTVSLLDVPGILSLCGPADAVLQDMVRVPHLVERPHRKTPCLVLVDPCSSLLIAARRAMQLGIGIVNLVTLSPKFWTNDHSELSLPGNETWFVSDVAEAKRMLARCAFQPIGLLPGFEASLPFADQLAQSLGLAGNDPGTSDARSSKIAMQQRMDEAGLPVLPHCVVDAENPFPDLPWGQVVVQPDLDAGSNQVVRFEDPDVALQFAQACLQGKKTIQDTAITRMLIRPFCRGQQVQVNGVSHKGQHKVFGFWKYDVLWLDSPEVAGGQTPVFERMYDGLGSSAQNPCIHYARTVLDALGHKEGPFALEMMVSPDGPILLELNPRFVGLEGVWRRAQVETLGYDAIDAALSACAGSHLSDPYMIRTPFAEIPDVPRAQGQKVPAWTIRFLRAHEAGTVVDLKGVFDSLQYVAHVSWYVQSGQQVERTTNLMNCLGHVLFLGPEDPKINTINLIQPKSVLA